MCPENQRLEDVFSYIIGDIRSFSGVSLSSDFKTPSIFPEDIENPQLWAGIVPITRVYGPAVNDVSLQNPKMQPPLAVQTLG